MRVESSGIIGGIIADRFGARGTQFNLNGHGTYSLPYRVIGAPKETKSYALYLEDKDAVPVTKGFPWIPWVACNISRKYLGENESIAAQDFVQGLNSYISVQGGSQSRELSIGYCGMSPPDGPHIYELTIYALDCFLELSNGFYMNEMFRKMDGHVLESATIKGVYK